MSKDDQLLRAYSTLVSLRDGVPVRRDVHEKWVHQYNETIERLGDTLDLDLSEFLVPPAELQRSIVGYDPDTGGKTYREGLWCERSVLMQRINSVLTYFTGLQTGQETRIGFEAS